MSHQATNWAMKVRGISPACKVVLFHLADRHNPDFGCFPSQDTLAHDCEMSRATVNRCLTKLEEAGLIEREQRIDPRTKRQQSTRYFLAFEMREARVSECDTESKAVSHFEQEPCLISAQSRVSNCDTNPVIEPVIEPVIPPPIVPPHRFEEFWAVYPRRVAKANAEKAWMKAVRTADPPTIIEAASAFAAIRAGEDKQFIPYPATWLNQKRWQDDLSQEQPGASNGNSHQPSSVFEAASKARQILAAMPGGKSRF